FRFKKWLILGFIALMAGHLAGGNFRASFPEPDDSRKPAREATIADTPGYTGVKTPLPSSPRENLRGFRDEVLKPPVYPILILVATGVLIILLIFMWLAARFNFVFLNAVTKNDTAIKAPFRAFKLPANSYFTFNVVMTTLSLLLAALVAIIWFRTFITLGAFDAPRTMGILSIILKSIPFLLALVVFIIIVSIVHCIANDFVLVIMAARNTTFMPAVHESFILISRNTFATVKYLFIKMGLGICAGIIAAIINLILLIGLLIPIIIVAAAFYALYSATPLPAQPVVSVIVFIIAFPVMLTFWYCVACLHLPFAVFFRTLSIKFLGLLDNRYNLFTISQKII
ncbi:MAG: hypothetical protein KKF80_01145, partial [Candidatus Omnitrophica bacterium]|nr:hypothetical protein [Candidatus Omnitrophota bacterium]